MCCEQNLLVLVMVCPQTRYFVLRFSRSQAKLTARDMNEPKRDGLGLEDKYLAEKNVCADYIGDTMYTFEITNFGPKIEPQNLFYLKH